MLDGFWEKLDRHRMLTAIAIGIWCIGLFTFRIGQESLFNDEGATWAYTTHPFAEMIAHIYWGDVHPPLYYVLAKTVTLIFGDNILTLRLFSVLGGTLLALLGIGPVRRAFGAKTGLIYGIAVAFTPAMITFAQEARMYTWSILACTAASLYACLYAQEGKRSDLVKLGLSTVGAAYLHYGALMTTATAHLVLVAWLLVRRDRTKLLSYAAMAALVVAAYAPWLSSLRFQMGTAKAAFWVPPLSWPLFILALQHGFSDRFDSVPFLFGYRLPAFLATLAVMATGLILAYRRDREQWHKALFLAATCVGTITTFALASWLFRPILAGRYVSLLSGLFALLFAHGLASIPKRGAAILAGTLAFWTAGQCVRATYTTRVNGPMKEVQAAIAPTLAADTPIVHFDWMSMCLSGYYFRNRPHFTYMPDQAANRSDIAYPMTTYGPDLAAVFRGHTSAQLVTGLPAYRVTHIRERLQKERPDVASRLQVFETPHSWYAVAAMPLHNVAEAKQVARLLADTPGP